MMLIFRFFKLLIKLPWWLSFSSSIAAYLYIENTKPQFNLNIIGLGFSEQLSPVPYVLIGLLSLFGFINLLTRKNDKRFLRNNGNHSAIQSMEWDDFELLVGAAYRKMGYKVKKSQSGADGGVDLYLNKGGESHIVQCKHYKKQKVGVKVVREMFGVMVGLSAASVSIVCSGGFTKDAYEFSKNKPIKLITGKELVRLINI
jgi:restriction system protein